MKRQVALAAYPGQVHAWVIDLPGCIASAADEASLPDTLPIAVVEHEDWLRRHGEAVERAQGWEIVERVDAASHEESGGEFCFAAEQQPLAADELERLIERMAFARADLAAAVEGLSDEMLDWAPPASSMRHVDPWAREARTIRGVFEHVLQLEVYYRDGLRDGAAEGIFARVGDAAAERAISVDMLRSLDDDARSRVYRPVRPSRQHADEWTVRKLARRIISHERAHAAEIMQRRTWPLLGVPDYSGGG